MKDEYAMNYNAFAFADIENFEEVMRGIRNQEWEKEGISRREWMNKVIKYKKPSADKELALDEKVQAFLSK